MQIIKSGWEFYGVFKSASAADREKFAAFYAEQIAQLNRKRAQRRTSHFDLSENLRDQDIANRANPGAIVLELTDKGLIAIGPVGAAAANTFADFLQSLQDADRAA